MKIYIGMPVYDNQVHAQVVQDLVDLCIEANVVKKDDLSYGMTSSPFISLNRNLIMQKGLDSDWILMWDSDIQVPTPKFLYKMIDTAYKHDAVITGLLCKIKHYDNHPEYACAMKVKNGYKRLTEAPSKPQEVDVMGAGITLIKSSWIKDNLEQPYYEFVDGKGENGPTILPEDWRFCEKVKEKGGKIIVEPRIETIHYGQGMWHHQT